MCGRLAIAVLLYSFPCCCTCLSNWFFSSLFNSAYFTIFCTIFYFTIFYFTIFYFTIFFQRRRHQGNHPVKFP